MTMVAALCMSAALPAHAQGATNTTIGSQAELEAFRDAVNGGKTYENETVELTASFEVDGWTEGIGSNGNYFLGTLDGGGHVITLTGSTGLFGQIGKSGVTAGTVKNLGVDAKINGYTDYIGAIAGSSYGTIQCCFVEGSIESSKDYLGGIVGKNVGTIEDCYTTVSIKATGIVKRVGGIAGLNYKINSNAGTIQRCYATGAINNINTNFGAGVGGIVGSNSAGTTIKNCIALNTSITGKAAGRIIISNYGSSDALADNYASPLTTGEWTEKEAGKKNGADLTEGNFITNATTEGGAFYGWNNGNTAWDFTTPANLPTLTGFTADQPVKDITRESTITKLLIKEIKTAADLATFRDAVNSGETYEGKTVTLANDITVTGWEVGIGIEADKKPFSGTFDGQGHVINLKGSTSLFALIGKANETYGTVKNLGVNAEIIANTTNTGGIVGHNYGTIQNCYTKGTITNDSYYTGGIVGDNGGTIQNCYSTALCTGNNATGGIVGKHSGTILQCYATGAINGKSSAGGIAGTFGGNKELKNCIALNTSITFTDTEGKSGRIISSPTASFLSNNHASPLLPGTLMEAEKKDGANLTKENFINPTTIPGVFTDWPTGDDGWDLTTASLPTLKVFKDENNPQPAKGITRKAMLMKLTIDSADDLKKFRDAVNGGETYKGLTVKLTADITVEDWTDPIGTMSNFFFGTFDGDGHVITLTGSTSLFRYVSTNNNKDAIVKNLGVKAEITTDVNNYIGAIAAFNYGTIQNCFTEGSITSTKNYPGGIAGQNNGTIEDCYSTASVETSASTYVGGIVGENNGIIQRCYPTGAIKNTNSYASAGAGGIVGSNNNSGKIKNCIALNKSITGRKKARIVAGNFNSAEAALSDNYASPLIPGEWTKNKVGGLDGADLTDDTFIGKGADEGAFAKWLATAWEFGDNSNLPKLKTTGLNPDIVISGQGDDNGNMPARSNFVEPVIEISTAVTYNADMHNDKIIRVKDKGEFTVNADGVSLKKLILEEGGQVVAEKAFNCNQLLAPRTLNNKWTAYGSPVNMQAVAKDKQTFYSSFGYDEPSNQTWSQRESDNTSFEIYTLNLIAVESKNDVPVTLTAPISGSSYLTIPADDDKKVETGSKLNTGIFLFCANPTLKEVPIQVAYILSDDGTRFERKENVKVKPFQSYLVANAATSNAVLSLRAGGIPTANDPIALPDSDFRIWGSNGQLYLSADKASEVAIYDLSGRLIRRFTLTGDQTLNLGRGLYLVRSNNITYKVSL